MNELLGSLIAGVDEVGRGPLAGPVVTAAVILHPDRPVKGLRDSKKLTPKRRAVLADEIRENALAWALGRAEVEEIDQINILQASLKAMARAVEALALTPTEVWVDGNQKPPVEHPVRCIVGGDDTVAAISAASILAKVARDTEMKELDERFPGYGLAGHKGYPTSSHITALNRLGPSPVHRMSYAPCQRALENMAK